MPSEVGFDVFPDVEEIDKVEVEGELIFGGDDLVANGICVLAKVELLIAGFDILDEALVKGSLALGCQRFVIRFDIHKPINYNII